MANPLYRISSTLDPKTVGPQLGFLRGALKENP
jgi:hypothetical protein